MPGWFHPPFFFCFFFVCLFVCLSQVSPVTVLLIHHRSVNVAFGAFVVKVSDADRTVTIYWWIQLVTWRLLKRGKLMVACGSKGHVHCLRGYSGRPIESAMTTPRRQRRPLVVSRPRRLISGPWFHTNWIELNELKCRTPLKRCLPQIGYGVNGVRRHVTNVTAVGRSRPG